MICQAVKIKQSKAKGKSSHEWTSKDGTKHYYCQGWIDASTECLLPVCRDCKSNVIWAQYDMNKEPTHEAKGDTV